MSISIDLSKLSKNQGIKIEDGGSYVSNAGDFNGDGLDDVIIASITGSYPNIQGINYLVYGQSEKVGNISLANLTTDQGIAFTYPYYASSVGAAGDVNRDGYDDIIIGMGNAKAGKLTYGGISYIIFGTPAKLETVPLLNITSTQGFFVQASVPYTINFGGGFSYNQARFSGNSVSGAGDINNDGYDDVVIGALYGKNYIVFGKQSGFSNLELTNMTASEGIEIPLGRSVKNVGDFNGDGINDVVVGGDNGRSYVVFGKSFLNSSNVEYITFRSSSSCLGSSVGGGGDINNDGYADVILGDYCTNNQAGISYLIFGNSTTNDINVDTLSSNQGIAIYGEKPNDHSGNSVDILKDINNDGYDDIIVGMLHYTVSPNYIINYKESTTYILFGKTSYSKNIYLNNTEGLFLVNNGNYSGYVSKAGDFNGDGYQDIIIGSPVHVVFGRKNFTDEGEISAPTVAPAAVPSTSAQPTYIPSLSPSQSLISYTPTVIEPSTQIDLNLISENQGKIIQNPTLYKIIDINKVGDFNGDGYNDFAVISNAPGRNIVRVIFGGELHPNNLALNISSASGITISIPETSVTRINSAGDFNGDGYSDLIFSNSYYTVDGKYAAGISYIIFGKRDNLDINTQNMLPSIGFKVFGTSWEEYSGSEINEAGDFNGDGYDDIIISSSNINSVSTSGTSYIIFGKSTEFSDIYLSNLPSNQGFKINYAGGNAAGDFNGDGYDDIIIGAHKYSGTSLLILGKPSNFININVWKFIDQEWQLKIDQDQGFKIIGLSGSETGSKASKAGDINGDGYGDIIIGDADDRPSPYGNPGISYIIFGKPNGFYDLTLSTITRTEGFKIIGLRNDYSGSYVSNIGDFNGDGLDDVIIGAPGASISSTYGRSYIILGNTAGSDDINLWNMTQSQGVIIQGMNALGNPVIGIGDFNGDGLNDVIISNANVPISFYNIDVTTYLIYGFDLGQTSSLSPTLASTIAPSISITSPTSHPSSNPSSYPTNAPSTAPKIIPISDKIYAVFAREVYANPDHATLLYEMNGNGSRLPSGWSVLLDSESAGMVSDTSIAWGFFAKAYKNDISDNIVIAFQGTDDLYDIFSADLDLALGKVPAHYSPAKEFVDYIINYYKLNPAVLSFTGHSLGGFLAQLMSATYNKLSVVFDSPGAGKVISDYYQDSSYSIEYPVSEISNKVKCFNSAPNLVNIASGAHFGNVIRIFPEFDPTKLIYTLQQHDMNNILLQFKTISGEARISSAMDGYWKFSGTVHNWPFYEAAEINDIDDLNSFLNDVFFRNYNQNPYFWEIAWDRSPNINSLSLSIPSTADRIQNIKSISATFSNSLLTMNGVIINGDDIGNKFFGGTNYADEMNGGKGNDEYYPFSGMDIITDTGGSNTYYFYTHNMKGTTRINDQDKTGTIKFVNIGCSIGKVYAVDEGSSNGFAFFPIFDSSCDLKKYSSGLIGSLINSNSVNHKNDIVLLKYSGGNLIIAYNNNDFNDINRDKISITNFREGDFGIYTNNNPQDNTTYIAIGGDADEQFICKDNQDSILAGLRGTNTYFIPLQNQFTCSIISNDDSSNVYKFQSSSVTRLSEEETGNKRLLNAVGSINILGFKKTDIIDISNINLKSFADLSYQKSSNGTILELPGGLSINLDQSETFLLTNGSSIAFYNSTSQTYETDITKLGTLGINATELIEVLNSTPSSYIISESPTMNPTNYPNNQENHDSTLDVGIMSGIAIGGLAALVSASYLIYAWNYNTCPFAGNFAKIAATDGVELV